MKSSTFHLTSSREKPPVKKEEYTEPQVLEMKFKKGDMVKVIRKANRETTEAWWDSVWVLPMDDQIGKIHEIEDTDIKTGDVKFVDDKFLYPVSVLELVEPEKPQEIKVGDFVKVLPKPADDRCWVDKLDKTFDQCLDDKAAETIGHDQIKIQISLDIIQKELSKIQELIKK